MTDAYAYLALGLAVLLGVAGQLLLKAGAGAPDFVAQLFRPATIVGLGCYVVSAFLYMGALRKLPVSIAFPSAALSYGVVALLAHWLLKEPLGWPQIAGIALVMVGVVVLNQT